MEDAVNSFQEGSPKRISVILQIVIVISMTVALVLLVVGVITGGVLGMTSSWKNPNDLRYHVYDFALGPYGAEKYRVHDNGGHPPIVVDIVLESDVTDDEIFNFEVLSFTRPKALEDMPRRWIVCVFTADGTKLNSFGLGREWCSFNDEFTNNSWMTREEFEEFAAQEPPPTPNETA